MPRRLIQLTGEMNCGMNICSEAQKLSLDRNWIDNNMCWRLLFYRHATGDRMNRGRRSSRLPFLCCRCQLTKENRRQLLNCVPQRQPMNLLKKILFNHPKTNRSFMEDHEKCFRPPECLVDLVDLLWSCGCGSQQLINSTFNYKFLRVTRCDLFVASLEDHRSS